MPKMKSANAIAAKWSRVTPTRSEDYTEGIKNPQVDWATATKAAEQRYKDGVVKAAQEGRFGKGVSAAGSEKWARKTADLGPRRWGEGVQAASPDFESGFKPYAETIESTKLPPRYAKGDPRNIQRVAAMAKALRDKKESLS